MKFAENSLGLHNLEAPRGARKPIKRLGRGESSGHGKTSGRGTKGQKARKSGNVRIGFEGGQVPLARRLPKRGFTPLTYGSKNVVVNLAALAERFENNAVVDMASLIAEGLVPNSSYKVKVLGDGEAKQGLKLKVHGISESAKKKIEVAGGQVEILA